ncbi:MAG TPA: RNA polymerase sigma factor [Candidatus Nanoarchaeia archaeon]
MIFGHRKPSSASLNTLIASAQNGNTEAFGEIYDQYIERVYRFVYFKVGRKEIAEDLTQDIFMKALENLGKYRNEGSFDAWIFAISRNTVIDYYRTKKGEISLDLIREPHAVDNTQHLEIKEEFERVFKVLQDLSEAEQEVIILHSIEQYSFSEIAGITDRNEEYLRVLKHRALKKLKEELGYGK